jgi:hypothetical protein
MPTGVYVRTNSEKERLRLALNNIRSSPEYKIQMRILSDSRIGMSLPKEIGDKISLAKKGIKTGQIPWNKGLTKETSEQVKEMGLATARGKRGWNWKGDQRKGCNGITIEKFNSMRSSQNNLCAICGEPEKRKTARGNICELTVDHSHKTNKIRGLLCHKCNVALGLFNDDINIISKAINYLKERN